LISQRKSAAVSRLNPNDQGGAAVKVPRTVQSVERALDILELLADGDDEMLLNEVASEAGLNTSTCHHLLATLVKRGFAGQSRRTRGYFLGPRVTDLSDSRLKKFNLLEIAMPEVRRLNDATRESVHLSVMQGVTLVTLARLDSKLPVRVGFDGTMEADAAHATATGKAILAWLPEAEIARVIAHGGLKRFTDKTIPTIADLMENLRLVRRNGFSLDDEEFQAGVVCVGAAIRETSGAVVGAISVSMPQMRADGEHMAAVRQQIMETASFISARLGGAQEGLRQN
jgi:IclR family transcriptional regulator, acetate operon repressor